MRRGKNDVGFRVNGQRLGFKKKRIYENTVSCDSNKLMHGINKKKGGGGEGIGF